MVHDGDGYRLSEAFDLLPDVGERHEHCLAFQDSRAAATREELLAVARQWGVRDAAGSIGAVVASMEGFGAVARSRGVPKANRDEIAADIARRVDRLEEPPSARAGMNVRGQPE